MNRFAIPRDSYFGEIVIDYLKELKRKKHLKIEKNVYN